MAYKHLSEAILIEVEIIDDAKRINFMSPIIIELNIGQIYFYFLTY